VAIKVLMPQLAASGTARQRFIREARAAAAVTHERVIAIYAVQEEGLCPYLVMQFVAGLSLEERVKQSGALELAEILRIGMQTAEGLAAAHKQGLVHRDIKPANILLENGIQRVKITDFGLARAADDASLTQSGYVAGTPLFMSPEQAEGKPVDPRSDLFSLGSVLYTLCTGQPPFRASGALAVLRRVMDDTSRPIRDINNAIPPRLADLIARLHAKKPADRFQTAQEVADLLGGYLTELQRHRSIDEERPDTDFNPLPGCPSHASKTLVAQSAARKQVLQRRVPLALAAGACLLVVGVVVAWVLLGNPGNKTNLDGNQPIQRTRKEGDPPTPPQVVPVFSPDPVLWIPRPEGWPNRALFIPRSHTALFSNSFLGCIVWDLKTNQALRTFNKHGRGIHVWGLAVSADGKQALSGDEKGKIFLWNVATGQQVRAFANPTPGVGHLAFMGDRQRFVSLDDAGNVRIWDLVSGDSKVSLNVPVHEGDYYFPKAFSAEANRLLIGQGDGSLLLWDVETGEQLRRWKGHNAPVTTVSFSRDTCRALSGDRESVLRLWDLKTEKEVAALAGHAGPVRSAVFTPDGRRALSGGADKTVRLWDLADRKEVGCFKGHTWEAEHVDVSSDGRYALSMTSGKMELALLWRLPEDPDHN
jgi:serine/threonine protein kinase